jgi:hypothetical protein
MYFVEERRFTKSVDALTANLVEIPPKVVSHVQRAGVKLVNTELLIALLPTTALLAVASASSSVALNALTIELSLVVWTHIIEIWKEQDKFNRFYWLQRLLAPLLLYLYCIYLWKRSQQSTRAADRGFVRARVGFVDTMSRSALLLLSTMVAFAALIMFVFQPSSLAFFSVFLRATGLDLYAVENTIESNLVYVYHCRLVLACATATAYLRWSALKAHSRQQAFLFLLIVAVHDGLSLLAHYLVIQSASASSGVPRAEADQWRIRWEQTLAFAAVSTISSLVFVVNAANHVRANDAKKTAK